MEMIDKWIRKFDGIEYPGRELMTRENEKAMSEDNIIIVIGQSDDIIDFNGVIRDEVGTGVIYFDEIGIIKNNCDNKYCPHFAKQIENAKYKVTAEFDGGDGFKIQTNIPHKTFNIMEDGELYCTALIFYWPVG